MHIAQLELPIGDVANTVGIPGAENAGAADAGFGAFISQMLVAVFAIATLLVFLYLIWGAIEWISSGGDKGKVEKARNRITQAVIGLIVLAATVVIMMILQGFLGVTILNFSGGSGSTRGRSNGGSTSSVCTPGTTANDGGAGGYCTNGGAAQVKCFGSGQGVSKLPYDHYEPCSCISGSERPGVNFSSC